MSMENGLTVESAPRIRMIRKLLRRGRVMASRMEEFCRSERARRMYGELAQRLRHPRGWVGVVAAGLRRRLSTIDLNGVAVGEGAACRKRRARQQRPPNPLQVRVGVTGPA